MSNHYTCAVVRNSGSHNPKVLEDVFLEGATDKIWMDGEFVPWDEAKIHVLTHSLHYGLGVFEGIRCYQTERGSAIFRFEEHMRRLYDSAQIVGLDAPVTQEDFTEAVLETIRANEMKGVLHPPAHLARLRVDGSEPQGVAHPCDGGGLELGGVPGRRGLGERHSGQSLILHVSSSEQLYD